MDGELLAESFGQMEDDFVDFDGRFPTAVITFRGAGRLYPQTRSGPHFNDVGVFRITPFGVTADHVERLRSQDWSQASSLAGFWAIAREKQYLLRWECGLDLFALESSRIGSWSGHGLGKAEQDGVEGFYFGAVYLVVESLDAFGLYRPPDPIPATFEDRIDWGKYHWRLWRWHPGMVSAFSGVEESSGDD